MKTRIDISASSWLLALVPAAMRVVGTVRSQAFGVSIAYAGQARIVSLHVVASG